MKDSFRYVFQQVLWLFSSGLTLIASMGVGARWMIMTVRIIIFAVLDMVYFIPHVLWYVFSPSIIRGVSYRSSKRTKIRNLEMFVQQQQHERELRASVSPQRGGGAGGGGSRSRSKSPSSPHSRAAAAAAAPAVDNSSLISEGGHLDLDSVERLAASLNPADGRFAGGLPVNLAEDLSHLTSNNSFDDALSSLQRLYQRRQDNQKRDAAATAAAAAAAEEEEANLAANSRASFAGGRGGGESFTESDDDEDEEDKQNLHNRAKLDIYLPVPLDSLFRFMDQEKKNEEAAAAAARENKNSNGKSNHKNGGKAATHAGRGLQRKKFPIVISVNGGAWIVGYSFWNFLIARVMAARGYAVFCPDYRNFPQTTMEGMTLDVSDAIGWILNNAERYNGDLDNVTLVGQSAGAHLTMMSLLSQAQVCSYQDAVAASPDGNVAVPPPSKVAYNVPRYNPRQSIRTYIGLSGIYNIRGLVRHFDRRGLYRSVLHQIAGGKANMSRFSIPAYFDDRQRHLTGEYLPDNIFEYLPRQMSFLHGDADKSAPVTESANVVYALRNAQRDALVRAYQADPDREKVKAPPSVIEFILVPGATHTDAIVEEPLSCNDSHAVEFLTLYRRADEQRKALLTERAASSTCGGGYSSGNGNGNGCSSPVSCGIAMASSPVLNTHGRSVSLQLGLAPGEFPQVTSEAASLIDNYDNLRSGDDADFHVIVPVRRPDGILLSPMPTKQRRMIIRLASTICPF